MRYGNPMFDTPITMQSPPLTRVDEPTNKIDLQAFTSRVRRVEGGEKLACLVLLGGLDMGRVIPVGPSGIIIGRSERCHLVVRDDGVSREHVHVAVDGSDGVLVRDLGSTNGTYVGGRRIDEARLHSGDKLFVGRSTVLKFVVQDPVDLTYQKKIFESSTHDHLTGVFNRRYFSEKMVADISFGQRHDLPLSLLMLDIDHFKQINDRYGHDVGDEVLRVFTQTVAAAIRTEDVLARYGGEEFVIIAQGTNMAGALALGERIRHEISNRLVWAATPGVDIKLTVSTGVATMRPGARVEAESLISTVDANMYTAKKSGRNRVVGTEID
ncbi:MAG: GGDEF domain-containing protein [Deltaproteobacteria bacterium]|nr:GGDEF domain-containing protein [Deltaproteobacteria bacterium]